MSAAETAAPAGRIARAFATGRPAFVAYLTAGDPDLESTAAFVRALARAGADVIELGVPFSDPIADGPVNQRAAERALAAGTTLAGILAMVRALRDDGLDTAIALFTYLNPLLALGPTGPERVAASGVDGVLAVDLPVEESLEHEAAYRAAGLDRIYLAGPTTSDARLARLGEVGSGFVYLISSYGVTGARASLPLDLPAQVERARRLTGRKVAVGFGVASPERAREVATSADGVVVGSAIVSRIADRGADALHEVESFALALAEAIHGARHEPTRAGAAEGG